MKHQYELITLTLDEYLSRKNILEEIRNNDPSGIIIKNFFSPEECSTLKEHYDGKTVHKSPLPLNQGHTYPTVFTKVLRDFGNDPKKNAEFFEFCSHYKATFKEEFGVDAPARIEHILQSGGGGRAVSVMPSPDLKNVYPVCSFRDLTPGAGEMTLHCGLFFYDLSPDFYAHILNFVEQGSQLSLFTVLQKPDSGGELTLFDVTWDDADKRAGDLELIAKDGSRIPLVDVDGLPVNIDRGDLIIFNGGHIWHRVELVHGNTNRITLGVFIGFSHDKKHVYYWA